MVTLAEFNAAPAAEAAQLVRPCLGVSRWVDALVDGRPYAGLADVLRAGETVADPLATAEVDAALAHHPRIGERAAGADAEASLSRGEQSGLDTSGSVQERLLAGNVAYEEKFGHVFLIRAAGRSSEEILAELDRRRANDEPAEAAETAEQLRQIAVLRLQGVFTP